MSRTQVITGKAQLSLTGSYQQLNGGVSAFYKSFTLQASFQNTGTVTLADASGNILVELTAGLASVFLGDNMDNGTAAKMDLSTVYAKSSVVGDKLNISVDDGL